jgi:exosortase/archaeosortase family protein
MSAASTLACRPVVMAPGAWLALHGIALWPHGLWAVRRVADGSDDPLGLAALAALLLWLVRSRACLRLTPHLAWLAASAVLTLAATAALFALPPLAAALLAMLALCAHLGAWLPERAPRAALFGLGLLALPWIASLQYYAGWPLRAFTAQVSAWLLQSAGIDAHPSGAAMTVAGRLVIVDAPCSGVQMAWLAYFEACSVAAFTVLPQHRFLGRLPLVGLVVLTGNVLRNSVLVALEARPQGLAGALHEAIGLLSLALVIALVLRLMTPRVVPCVPGDR